MLLVEITPEGGLRERGIAAIGKHFTPLGGGDGLPSWVTGNTSTWDSPVFNRESPDLFAARVGIRRALRGEADFEIVTPGDSKFRRAGVLNWPEQVKQLLGGVDGFVVADDGVTDSRWSVSRLRISGTTSVIGVIPTTGSEGQEKRATFTSTDPHTGLVALVRASAGASVMVTVDGAPTTVTIPASTAWQEIPVSGLSNSTHTVAVSSMGDTFEVLGYRMTYPTPRLKISNPARSSTNAVDWAPGSARWSAVVDGPATEAGLIISGLGTNSATDLAALTTYYNGLAALNVPVLIASPGGLGNTDRPRGNVEPMMNRLYQLAQQHDQPLIDFEKVIGQYTAAAAAGLMSDTVHESTRGLQLEALAVVSLLVG